MRAIGWVVEDTRVEDPNCGAVWGTPGGDRTLSLGFGVGGELLLGGVSLPAQRQPEVLAEFPAVGTSEYFSSSL